MNIFWHKMQFWKRAIFLMQVKLQIKSNIWFLIFFLQYFNCFGEVIFSPLIYFNKKYFSERQIIKTKNPRLITWWKNQIWKFKKIPNSLRGSLSCLGFIEDLSKCNKSWYANDDLCITFQIENLGCYKPTPLKMNLALEIRVG